MSQLIYINSSKFFKNTYKTYLYFYGFTEILIFYHLFSKAVISSRLNQKNARIILSKIYNNKSCKEYGWSYMDWANRNRQKNVTRTTEGHIKEAVKLIIYLGFHKFFNRFVNVNEVISFTFFIIVCTIAP